MKLTIDTEAKTIRVYHPIELKDFIKEIKSILPDYKQYTLECPNEQIYVPYYPQPYYSPMPWEFVPTITSSTLFLVDCVGTTTD